MGTDPKGIGNSLAFELMQTLHTYPNLLVSGGRLAVTNWGNGLTLSQVVAATLRYDPEAIILAVKSNTQGARLATGYAPGGLG